MNNIAPLSAKQRRYLQRIGDSWLNVAEGGKRGGKNVLNTLAFCIALESHPNRIHLIAGVSQSTARVNILDCDGYGLLNYFENRYRKGKFEGKECVYIDTLTGEKVILVAGGAKKGDEKYIKGNTYGMAYITEANECADCFIKEVFDRTLSSDDRKVFHDLNPKAPNHWYYSDVLGYHEKQQAADCGYGYNYGHFTIADNYSISDDKLRKILATYEKGTVWYERDIRGLRRTAKGIVFPKFANAPDSYVIDIEKLPQVYEWADIGFDIGGNGSAYAMTCTAQDAKGILYVLRSVKQQAESLPMEDVEQFVFDFINGVERDYCIEIDNVNCDHSDVIINTLNNRRYIFGKTYKPPLEDRPFLFSAMMAQGKFKLVRGECDALCDELCNLVYDEKQEKPIPLDDGTMQIDTWDSLTYSCAAHWHYIND